MKQASDMNEMMQLMMSRANTIKIKPFSGEPKDCPKWELKQRNNFIMADMGHVVRKSFLLKLPASKDQELDPSNPSQKNQIKYRRQNAKAVAAIVAAQESEDMIVGLKDTNDLVVTFPSGVVCKNW